MSTAVHTRRIFPYISPAGTLWAINGAGHTWKADRIVDGGYDEAQGARTLIDLLHALAAHWENKKGAGEFKKYSGKWDDELVSIVISTRTIRRRHGETVTRPNPTMWPVMPTTCRRRSAMKLGRCRG